MSNSKTFIAEVERLLSQKPTDGFDYYEISLLGNEDGTVTTSVTTQFVGYTETKPPREIREASLVDADKMLSSLRQIGEPGLLVNDASDLTIFMLFGGHAVIEKSLAEKYFLEHIRPRDTVYRPLRGHLVVSSMPPPKLQHAPSKKLRSNVLKRDDSKCRRCGRSPNNNVDIELHVHHIFPWGRGGITEDENLITLCSTCHDGLDPHYELALFSLMAINPISEDLRNREAKYLEGLKRYQIGAFEAWKESKTATPGL